MSSKKSPQFFSFFQKLSFCGMLLLLSNIAIAQTTLFDEDFNGPDGLTAGNSLGILWSTLCSGCGPGHFETRSNRLEVSGTNQAVSFLSDPIDISNCSTLTLTLEYVGQDYAGAGNFEMPSEAGTCGGDPYNPDDGDCDGFWDFFLAELAFNDGTRQRATFIGNGNFASSYNGPFVTPICVGDLNTVSIDIRANASASGEVMFIDNVMLVCNEGSVGPQPFSSSVVYCDGETVNMTIPPVGGATYRWFDTNGNLIGNDSPSLTFISDASLSNASDQQTISYILTDGSGCNQTFFLNILVFEAPSVNINIAALDFCTGDDVTLVEDGGDGTSFSWTGPASNNPGDNDTWSINDISTSDAGTYTVVVSDASICTSSDQVTLTVSPSDSYSLPDYGIVCPTDDPFPLDTKFGSINGNWQNNNGVNNNIFEPSSVTPGFITITFEPDNLGCVGAQIAQFTVSDAPATFPASIAACGAGQVLFNLSDVEETVNGGTGLDVTWFADMDATTPIASSHSSGTVTVYAVVTDGLGCSSEPQPVELMVNDGPEINMPDTILACVSLMLPDITITNGTGNERYYNEQGGMGTSYLPGEIFTLMDTVLYIYDNSGTCEAEHDITLLIGTPRNAGINLAFDTCAIGVIDLFSIKDPQSNTGFFINTTGDTLVDGLLNSNGLAGINIDLIYSIPADRGCPVDQAMYSLFFEPFSSAGIDSSAIICLGESIDIATMTEDGGASGSFYLIGASNTVSTNIITDVNDLLFDRTYLYVTDSGNSCPLDTAFLSVRGVSNDTTFISGNFCPDYQQDVMGTIYDINNPSGTEMDAAAGNCGGVISVDLTFRAPSIVRVDQVLCTGQFIIVNGVRYDENNLVGTEVILGGDQFGCDSTINIDISFDNEITFLIDDVYCSSTQVDINGTTYTINNPTGSATLASSAGCDSIVMVDLTFEDAVGENIDGIFCPEDSVLVGNQVFNINNPIGIVELPHVDPNRCDTVLIVMMDFDMGLTRNFENAICSTEEIVLNGTTYNASNPSGTENISNPSGCDSLFIINLEILESDSIYVQEIFCTDTSLVINGVTYNMSNRSGEEFISGGADNGCNQYVFVDLEYEASTQFLISGEICLSDSILVNGISYNADNPIGQEILINSIGCDSIVDIDLSFVGLGANIEVVSPLCDSQGAGYIIIEILQGRDDLVDVILDGVSIFSEFLDSDTIRNISFGTHDIEIIDNVVCGHKQTFSLEVAENNDFEIMAAVTGEGYRLGINFTGELESILWSPSQTLSCNNCPNPIAKPTETTTYEVIVQDINGCVFSDTINLDFIFIDEYYRPNVFSPNEDGVNDIFFIASQNSVPFTDFQIFDRWGNKVFGIVNGNTGDPNFGWNGVHHSSPAAQGVYLFFITLDLPSGPQTISGDISLIR